MLLGNLIVIAFTISEIEYAISETINWSLEAIISALITLLIASCKELLSLFNASIAVYELIES